MIRSLDARQWLAPAAVVLSLWLSSSAGAGAAGRSAVAPSEAPAGRAQQRAAFEAYAVAWGTSADGERLQALKQSLANGMTYKDASAHAEGVAGVDAMIAKFQHQRPGAGLRLDDLLLWGDHGLARWSMLDSKGGIVVQGYDAVTYDDRGAIMSIVGFFDVPGQRAR